MFEARIVYTVFKHGSLINSPCVAVIPLAGCKLFSRHVFKIACSRCHLEHAIAGNEIAARLVERHQVELGFVLAGFAADRSAQAATPYSGWAAKSAVMALSISFSTSEPIPVKGPMLRGIRDTDAGGQNVTSMVAAVRSELKIQLRA